jgi:hypothetical protein
MARILAECRPARARRELRDDQRQRSARWALAALLLVGCAGGGAPRRAELLDTAARLEGAPSWVFAGCAPGEHQRGQPAHSLCGVGSMASPRHPTRARDTAISRARTEVARSLEIHIQAMLADYQAAASGGSGFGRSGADEALIVDVSRQITRVSISGSEVRRTWTAKDGTVFALVILDVERFRASVREMRQLSDHIRRAIDTRAKAAFAGRAEAPAG